MMVYLKCVRCCYDVSRSHHTDKKRMKNVIRQQVMRAPIFSLLFLVYVIAFNSNNHRALRSKHTIRGLRTSTQDGEAIRINNVVLASFMTGMIGFSPIDVHASTSFEFKQETYRGHFPGHMNIHHSTTTKSDSKRLAINVNQLWKSRKMTTASTWKAKSIGRSKSNLLSTKKMFPTYPPTVFSKDILASAFKGKDWLWISDDFILNIDRTLNLKTQSPGWERARQKRTAAVKSMVDKKIITMSTDDLGNQFLSLPWIPDRKIPYKSLSIAQRLRNEVCAGAFGEICKDLLLHPVDTAKNRRQARKKLDSLPSPPIEASAGVKAGGPEEAPTDVSFLVKFKDLYVAFPIVMLSSIPQGGIFFIVKKGLLEIMHVNTPDLPEFIASMVSISVGVMAYWLFRTPAEVIKTQVQTGQSPSVWESVESSKSKYANGLLGLWKHYAVMLSLDIPFQVMNFILYGLVSDAVQQAGFAPSTWTRLFIGVFAGMVCAGATCPLDVCKTRIISRDRAAEAAGVTSAPAAASPTSPSSSHTSLHTSWHASSSDEASSHGNTSNVSVASTLESEGGTLDPEGGRPETQPLVSMTTTETATVSPSPSPRPSPDLSPTNVLAEMVKIVKEEGAGTLFLGFPQRLAYTGLANGIRLAAYGTSRMDLMMKSFDDI